MQEEHDTAWEKKTKKKVPRLHEAFRLATH